MLLCLHPSRPICKREKLHHCRLSSLSPWGGTDRSRPGASRAEVADPRRRRRPHRRSTRAFLRCVCDRRGPRLNPAARTGPFWSAENILEGAFNVDPVCSSNFADLVLCCFLQIADERDRSHPSDCARCLSARDAKMPAGNYPTVVLKMDHIPRQVARHRFATTKVSRNVLALQRFFLAAHSCRLAKSCRPERRPPRGVVHQFLRWCDILGQTIANEATFDRR